MFSCRPHDHIPAQHFVTHGTPFQLIYEVYESHLRGHHCRCPEKSKPHLSCCVGGLDVIKLTHKREILGVRVSDMKGGA
jgi:hypothetical protein